MRLSKLCAFMTAAVAVIALMVAMAPAPAQQQARRGAARRVIAARGAAVSPLRTIHQTLEAAAKEMESALPIYDGHRHRAIELARMAAREVRDAGLAASGRSAPNPAAIAGRLPAAQRAARVPKGANAARSRYTVQQIAASNARMQAGMQQLQQALQQLQSMGAPNGSYLGDAAEFTGYSLQAANQGLQFIGR